jgi:hypothetical protein
MLAVMQQTQHCIPPSLHFIASYTKFVCWDRRIPSAAGSSEWSLPLEFSNLNSVCIPHAPAHYISLHRSILMHVAHFNIWWKRKILTLIRRRYFGDISPQLICSNISGYLVKVPLSSYSDGVRFMVGAKNLSLLHSVQTSSEAHPASYRMTTGGKPTVAWTWTPTSI